MRQRPSLTHTTRIMLAPPSPLQSGSLSSLRSQNETPALARREVRTPELLVFSAPHRPCTFFRVPGVSKPRPQREPTGRERYVTRHEGHPQRHCCTNGSRPPRAPEISGKCPSNVLTTPSGPAGEEMGYVRQYTDRQILFATHVQGVRLNYTIFAWEERPAMR